MLFDFESGAQGWSAADGDVTAVVSTVQVVGGSQSLAITLPALTSTAADADAGTSNTCSGRLISVSNPAGTLLWGGAVVTLHVWVPAAIGNLNIQAFSQTNGWQWNSSNNSGNTTLTAGGWTTWTYTLPSNIPAGVQQFGIQAQVCGGGTFAGGTIYVDSITVSGGAGSCAGTATSTFDFETAGSVNGWSVNNTPADTAISQSGTQAFSGSGALKVSFTNLAPSDAGAVSRQIKLDGANLPGAYCGQTVTYHVWAPAGFAAAGMNVQAFSQGSNYTANAFGAWIAPTEGAWTTITHTVGQVDQRGVNRIGLQFNLLASATAAFTGDVYIDQVAW
jgi:hypothetical protein